jgi:hypothetical protein
MDHKKYFVEVTLENGGTHKVGPVGYLFAQLILATSTLEDARIVEKNAGIVAEKVTKKRCCCRRRHKV